jgi:hypothetical protein
MITLSMRQDGSLFLQFGFDVGKGPTGRGNLAQGLPWETRSKVMNPEAEGTPAYRDVVPGHLVGKRPPGMSKRQRVECFRASGDKPKTQSKPWAKLF